MAGIEMGCNKLFGTKLNKCMIVGSWQLALPSPWRYVLKTRHVPQLLRKPQPKTRGSGRRKSRLWFVVPVTCLRVEVKCIPRGFMFPDLVNADLNDINTETGITKNNFSFILEAQPTKVTKNRSSDNGSLILKAMQYKWHDAIRK